MNRLVRLAVFICLILFTSFRAGACGFDFVGDCSTRVNLRINNTLDSFKIAPCPSGTHFDSLDLGLIQSLAMAGGYAITWESCQNNVTNVAVYYRVYPQNQAGGAWQSIDLVQDYFTLAGPYTTRYRSKYDNINLTNGLTVGAHYVLEVYLRAEIDTIGDDFIPETFIVQNNGGQNYHMSFQYGGLSAPPFSVVTTHVKDLWCPGDTVGEAGVTVYGNQANLFYAWSGFNNNFPTLYNLSAGIYTVTVSGVGGYTQTESIEIHEPPALQSQFYDVVPVSCNGASGAVSALATGGVAPYTYAWNTGQQGNTTTVPASGLWMLNVTDAHGCQATFDVEVPGTTASEREVYQEICSGDTFSYGGQTLSASGQYDILLDGPGGCDTLAHLQLVVLDPAVLLAGLPAEAALSCAAPSLVLCMGNAPGASYAWFKDGEAAGNENCLNLTAGGEYLATVAVEGQQAGCFGSATVTVTESFLAPDFDFTVINASGAHTPDGAILAAVSGGAAPFYITWEGGTVVDSQIALNNLEPGEYCFTVTGADGCSATACATVSYATSSSLADAGRKIRVFPNPANAGDWLQMDIPAPLLPGSLRLTDALGRTYAADLENTGPGHWRMRLPEGLPSGPLMLCFRGKNPYSGIILLK